MTIIRRKFSDTGDFQLNQFVTGTEATAQALTTRLKLFLGEFFLDKNDGVDYFGSILTKPFNLGKAELILKERILETDGIKELVSFEALFDSETRRLTINFTVIDEYGNEITNEDIKGLNPIGF